MTKTVLYMRVSSADQIAELMRQYQAAYDAVVRGDREALMDYRARAPHAVRAHPTDEHFLTLFFALGAAGWGEGDTTPEYLSREIMYRYLAMDALVLN